MNFGITPQQARCLEAIKRLTAEKGYAPSYVEIGMELGLPHKSNVHRLVQALIGRRLIAIDPHHRRSIVVLRQGPSREDMLAWSPEEFARVAKDMSDIAFSRFKTSAIERADAIQAEGRA